MRTHRLWLAMYVGLVQRAMFWTLAEHRRIARKRIVEKTDDDRRYLVSEGAWHQHVMVSLFDDFAICGAPTWSTTGGDETDVDCRRCRRILRRAGLLPAHRATDPRPTDQIEEGER